MSFVQDFENKVKKTIKDYKLLKKNDKIIVACSGGKDSSTALYLLNKFGYNVEALFIDLGIKNSSGINLENLTSLCKRINVKLNVFKIKNEIGYDLKKIHEKKGEGLTTCAVCGIIKRYYLNKISRELEADKLVTGHNLDDAAENVLLNIFGGNLIISLNLGPFSGFKKSKKFTSRVKPLYFCSNEETKKFSKLMNFKIIYSYCPLSVMAFRKKVRVILRDLEALNKNVKLNLVNAFLELLPGLRKKYGNKSSVNFCTSCGEPCRNKFCNFCELVN